MRAYYFLTSVDAVGTGLFFSGSVLFLVQGVGLSSGQVGTGMGLAALAGFLTTVPLGLLANRVGAQRMLLWLQLWRGVCYALYAFVTSFWGFVLLACLVGMAERMDPPLTQAVLGSIVGESGRSHAYVQVRRLRNAGFGVGALFAAAAALHNSVPGYRLLVLGNALSFFLAALLLMRIRVSGSATRPRSDISLRGRAIRDVCYLRLTAVNVLLTLYMTMLPLAIPLWILKRTAAPRPVIQLIFVLSIVVVIVFQKRFSRGADDAPGSRRCLVRAAWSLSLGAAAVGLTGWIHDVGWVVVLLIGAGMLVTAAELWQTVGGWNLSYALAPEAQRPEYLAVFSLSSSAQRVIGPPLFTILVIPLGPWGWLLLAVAFAVLALLTGILLGPAREAPGTPAGQAATPAPTSPQRGSQRRGGPGAGTRPAAAGWTGARHPCCVKSHVAFLESNATGSGYEAIRAARDRGRPVTFVTRDIGYYLRPGQLPFPMDAIDRVITCETNDPAAVVAALRPVAHELTALISVGEWYLQGAAEAASQLGLAGQSPDAVRAVRDKSVTRQLCASAGVPVPRFARVTSAAAARQADVGFPCVVKPLDDAMSHGVRLCRNRDEVAEHAARLLADTRNIRGQRKIPAVLVEEYAEGPEVSVEAFAWAGTVQIVMITHKLLVPPPDFFEAGHAVPAVLAPATAVACCDVVRRGLAAIGYDFGAVHAELRLTAQGPKIIEINGRLAGGHITHLVKLATGSDMTATLIGMHLGQPPPPPRPATEGAAIVFLPGRAGTVRAVTGTDTARSVPGVCEVMVLAGLSGTVLRRPAGNADRAGHVIATGATGAAALSAARQAAAAIHIDMEPTM